MRIHVRCPACGGRLLVREDDIGERSRCPQCKETIIVPAAAPPRDDEPVSVEVVDESVDETVPVALVDETPATSDLGMRLLDDLPAARPAPVAPAMAPMPTAYPSPAYTPPVEQGITPDFFTYRPSTVTKKGPPPVLQIFGYIFRIFAGALIGLMLIAVVVSLSCRRTPPPPSGAELQYRQEMERRGVRVYEPPRRSVGELLLDAAISIAVVSLVFITGGGMINGRKWAVVAVLILGALWSIGGLSMMLGAAAAGMSEGGGVLGLLTGAGGLIMLGVAVGLHLPPVISGFRHWRQLT